MRVFDLPAELCCGCGACAEICPAACIRMTPDSEGFLRPVLVGETCLDCGRCLRCCPFAHPLTAPPAPADTFPLCYAVKSREAALLSSVSSGGVATLLSRRVIQEGGIVYGVGFDEHFDVRHMRAETMAQLENFKLSKYVQSDTRGIYEAVLRDLRDTPSQKVLFIGTACQTAALQRVAEAQRVSTDNLLLCDVLCHGVPSPDMYREVCELAKRKCRSEITAVRFRGKTHGWNGGTGDAAILFANGKSFPLRDYLGLYFDHYILRPSCTNCPYTVPQKPSDLTVADFWAVGQIAPDFDANGGVSLVVLQTQKGQAALQGIFDEVNSCPVGAWALTARQFVKPADINPDAARFWEKYRLFGFERAMKAFRRKRTLRSRLSSLYHRLRGK